MENELRETWGTIGDMRTLEVLLTLFGMGFQMKGLKPLYEPCHSAYKL